MVSKLSDQEISEALATCAQEPVHIPGTVQTFGALVAIDPATTVVRYASANAEAFLGVSAQSLLGQRLQDYLDRLALHAIKNALSRPEVGAQAIHLGTLSIAGHDLSVHCFESAGLAVLEFEEAGAVDFTGDDGLKTLRLFMENIETASSEQALYELTTQLLRHVTGYHRVMFYKFDDAFNGEVLAEDRRSDLPGFLGLRFPHWDIPPQAREMMRKAPLRVIEDVDQTPAALLAQPGVTAPLDISLAVTRGVSAIHMEYLRNMDVASSMTLTVMLGTRLWGIISFHHQMPRVPSASLREVLVNIGQIFATKLNVLQQQSRLDLMTRVERLKDSILRDADGDTGMARFMEQVSEALRADGVVVIRDGYRHSSGAVPDDAVLDQLRSRVSGDDQVVRIEALAKTFPDETGQLNGVAGVLAYGPDDLNCLMVFRRPVVQEINWAGNPEKEVETVDDRLRITPRGSFATYLQTVDGHCAPWTQDDVFFADRFWFMVSTIEGRAMIAWMNRQQKVMISELNHRVRNILALVQSVSRQAQSSAFGSLDSYATSLEARIQALAEAHELALGAPVGAASVNALIQRELLPFADVSRERFRIVGSSAHLLSKNAPIFSLVVHELVTNAVKYGALSSADGFITIELKAQKAGLTLCWREKGGPRVTEPAVQGFGSTLIRHAIPYELDGQATLRFAEAGVEVDLFLPRKLFAPDAGLLHQASQTDLQPVYDAAALHSALSKVTCLLVEDNFVIARGMQKDLLLLGVRACDAVGDLNAAMDYLKASTPDLAVLDINLGRMETSYPVAQKLVALGVPFIFITGYGDTDFAPPELAGYHRLTKPVSANALKDAIAHALLSQPD